MSILDPILYCGGQLRLTRHGDKGGGTSLVIVDPDPGFIFPPQIDVPDAQTEILLTALEEVRANDPFGGDPYFAMGYCIGAIGRYNSAKGV